MARNWDELSDNYRGRLERKGISRNEYESGVNLSEARGHGLSREALIEKIQDHKSDLFGGKRRWNGDKSEKHLRQDLDGDRRSTEDLRKIARIFDHYSDDTHMLWETLTDEGYEDAGFYN